MYLHPITVIIFLNDNDQNHCHMIKETGLAQIPGVGMVKSAVQETVQSAVNDGPSAQIS